MNNRKPSIIRKAARAARSFLPQKGKPRRRRATFYAPGSTPPRNMPANFAGILAAHRSGLLDHFTA